MLGGVPGSAILLNGVQQTANREIGVPGSQRQVPEPTYEFKIKRPPKNLLTPQFRARALKRSEESALEL
jgi:hypothetical protein